MKVFVEKSIFQPWVAVIHTTKIVDGTSKRHSSKDNAVKTLSLEAEILEVPGVQKLEIFRYEIYLQIGKHFEIDEVINDIIGVLKYYFPEGVFLAENCEKDLIDKLVNCLKNNSTDDGLGTEALDKVVTEFLKNH